MISISYLPKELINIILEYDGRIKEKRGKYVNIIHKHDLRYNIIQKIVTKKLEIMLHITFVNDSGFYFEFSFDKFNKIGLCYDYNFSYQDKFEICYYDWRNDQVTQIRTYL
jgi:hypothetical protein